MDPWFYAISKEVMDGQMMVRCPLLMMHSETYHSSPSHSAKNFDSWGCVQKTAKDCKMQDLVENLTVIGATHKG